MGRAKKTQMRNEKVAASAAQQPEAIDPAYKGNGVLKTAGTTPTGGARNTHDDIADPTARVILTRN